MVNEDAPKEGFNNIIFSDKLSPKQIEKIEGYIREVEEEGSAKKVALRSLRNLYHKYVPKEKSMFQKMTCKNCSLAVVMEFKRQLSRIQSTRNNGE